MIWRFLSIANSKEHDRITHICDVSEIKAQTNAVVIIDECDDIIFKDVQLFYKHTKQANKTIIALTASPTDGTQLGVERKILDKMAYF